jgi:hypothetical protein
MDTTIMHRFSFLWTSTRVRALLPVLSLVAVVLAGGAGTKWT